MEFIKKYASLVSSILALIATIITAVTAYLMLEVSKRSNELNQRSIETSVKPILQFFNVGSKWVVGNYGLGPAVNIIICHTTEQNDQCVKYTRIPAVPPKTEKSLCWIIGKINKIKAYYEDVNRKAYTSVVDDGYTKIQPIKYREKWSWDQIPLQHYTNMGCKEKE